MADIQEDLCAFCKEGEDAGTLRNTSDEDILAHYNCLLFSPRVITRPQDSQDNTVEFDITSVKTEIKRGKKLKCSYCNKAGATVGCNVRKCWRTYHYQCVTKHKGIRIRNEDEEQYIAYCFEHSEKDQDAKDCLWNNHSKRSGMPITPSSSNKSPKNKTPKKRKEKMENGIARKAMRFEEKPVSGIVQNAKMQSVGEQELHIHSSEDMEVPGPSRTYLEHEDFCIKHGSGSDVESSESNGSHSAQIKIEQHAGMLVESERMQIPSNHRYDHMEIPGSSTSFLQQGQPGIVNRSSIKTEEDLQTLNGSQLVSIKRENSTEDDTFVAITPSRVFSEIPGSSTSFLQQGQPGIVNRSSIKTEEDLQTLNGSQLVSIKRENSTEDDTFVAITPSRVFSQTLPSPSRESAIFIGSHMETEEDLPTVNGSQLVSIKRKENSMEDDTSVTGTPSRVFQETLPSTSRERTSSSSTDSSGSWTPEILRSVSFSDFPKRSKQHNWKQNNPELETALLTMQPEERNVYSQLYDEVRGSLDISTNNDCDDQNTGTYAALTGTPVHDATSVLQGPRHSPGLASSPSQQPINNANKQAFSVKEPLKKEAPTSREETPPTSPGVKGGKAADVQSVTFHPSPLHIKKLSDQLKKGVFCKDFKKITLQFPSTAEPVMTSPSKLQSKEDDLASEKSPDHSIVSQQAQKDLSNVDGNLENSGQTVDGPGSSGDPPEDGPMLVEEITHTVEDTVFLSGQTTDEPGSSGDLPEDRPMLVEKITHTIKDTVPLSEKTLQTPCPNLNAEVKTASIGAPATHELHMYSTQLAMQSCSRESTSNWGTDERKEELEQAAEELPSVSTTEHEQQINQLQVCQERRSADSFLNPNNPRAIFCNYLFHILEDIDGDLATQCMDHLCSIAIQYRTAKKRGIPPPTYPSTVSQGPPV